MFLNWRFPEFLLPLFGRTYGGGTNAHTSSSTFFSVLVRAMVKKKSVPHHSRRRRGVKATSAAGGRSRRRRRRRRRRHRGKFAWEGKRQRRKKEEEFFLNELSPSIEQTWEIHDGIRSYYLMVTNRFNYIRSAFCDRIPAFQLLCSCCCTIPFYCFPLPPSPESASLDVCRLCNI